jgi:hypothetical protein
MERDGQRPDGATCDGAVALESGVSVSLSLVAAWGWEWEERID